MAKETARGKTTRSKKAQSEIIPRDISSLGGMIRTETVVSRLPIHKLGKFKELDIRIETRTEQGTIDLKWEVSANKRYGHPGPLAYRIDTEIVNRLLDEIGRPVPRILCLGSMNAVAKELSSNKQDVKLALQQNAATIITAKVRYKAVDGREMFLEATFNRYNVILAGERLPTGEKAEAIYIIFSDPYLETLNRAQWRPIAYDYLKSLPPLARRWYEIVSYKIFPALKYGHGRAKMYYSEYCTYSASERETEYRRMRWQMNRLHKPHLDSGYLADVEYKEIIGADGLRDWVIFYTPGPLAREHFNAVSKKELRQFVDVDRHLPASASIASSKSSDGDAAPDEEEAETYRQIRESAVMRFEALSPRDKQARRERAIKLIKQKMTSKADLSDPAWEETITASILEDLIEEELNQHSC